MDYSFIGVGGESRQILNFRKVFASGEHMNENAGDLMFYPSLSESEMHRQADVTETDLVFPSLWLLERFLRTTKQSALRRDSQWGSRATNSGTKPVAEILKFSNLEMIT